MNTLSIILSAISLAELAGLITTIALLRPNRKKAMEEAQRIHAEARKQEIENDERMTRIMLDTIVTPLRNEVVTLRDTVNELRTEVEGLRKEVERLKRTIQKANTCQHKEGCPVLAEMQTTNQ